MAVETSEPYAAGNVSRGAVRRGLTALAGAIQQLVLTIVIAAIVLGGGFKSATYMIDHGSPLSTETFGPWTHWPLAGHSDADPYTRAHFARAGVLPLPASAAGVFEARIDALGARLHSSCDYIVEGPSAGAQWWSLGIFNDRGELIANDAGRYAFTSDNVASNPDGSYFVTLGRDARPGNWLPTSGAGRLVLVFTLLDPATGLSAEERDERIKLLPVIRREGCS